MTCLCVLSGGAAVFTYGRPSYAIQVILVPCHAGQSLETKGLVGPASRELPKCGSELAGEVLAPELEGDAGDLFARSDDKVQAGR